MTEEQKGLQGYTYFDNYEDIKAVMEENLSGERLGMSALDTIKVPSGGSTSFEVETLNGTESVKELRGVIVYDRQVRTYWENSFDETGGGSSPDCYSDDAVTGKGIPGGNCQECNFGKFGPNGEHPLCRECRDVYIITTRSALPTLLRIPPSSIKRYREFKVRLASHVIPLGSVEVIISLEKDQSKAVGEKGQSGYKAGGIAYSRMAFRIGERATQEQKEMLASQSESIKSILAGSRRTQISAGSIRQALPEATEAQELDSDIGI